MQYFCALMTIELNGRAATLLYEKALYLHDEELLVIADVHLGKASHFRKAGIPIPAGAQMSDFDNLACLFNKTKPKTVYFLGDLFHSSFNRDWHYFCDLIGAFPHIAFVLVKGNHDLIKKSMYKELCVEVVERIENDAFVFTHDRVADVPAGKLNIVGHIHPGVVLSGMGRQSIKLPCFYLTETYMLLPAFGVLTGLYSMDRSKSSQIYIVLQDGIKRL
ncbi:MAG: ligase-associated DNA damage response endonuclease PdeM [Bacteroidota bacterium]